MLYFWILRKLSLRDITFSVYICIFQLSCGMWYKSYLENRKQCVRVINVTYVYLDYNIGVPQGSILGPNF